MTFSPLVPIKTTLPSIHRPLSTLLKALPVIQHTFSAAKQQKHQHSPSTMSSNTPPHHLPRHAKGGKKGRHGGPKKQPLTHFLCLPLITPESRAQLDSGLSKLKQELRAGGLVPVEAVRPVDTLHLTLGVMSLASAPQLCAAVSYLQDLDVPKMVRNVTARAVAERAAESGAVAENLSAGGMPDCEALAVQLRGLVPMQTPGKTSILYAEPVDGTGRLLSLAEKLKGVFEGEGLLVEDKRALRLHATVLNTVYAKGWARGRRGKMREETEGGKVDVDRADDGVEDSVETTGFTADAHEEETPTAPSDPSTRATSPPPAPSTSGADGHGPNAKSWLRFDASDLIERYKDLIWTDNVRIDRVQICKMGAKKILDGNGTVVGEAYEVVAEKSFGG